MQVNDVIHGFRVIRVAEAEEIKAVLYEMVHEKTGAKTIWLKRADENKTFSIAFKTTPVDDTGVFHILEHSVLNGSKKYPVREPFVDLLKGSLQTFLNAMTYPDKTVYPVSSRNNKDFINLMRVYLDAVFNPLVLENRNTFYQEGWHYELNDVDAEPIYKGVVFNEMKGAFSSPDSIRSRMMMHQLFPDSCYGNESGGDPEHITDLSYEQFCAAHRKYYNPSNSYIFLDGDLNIDTVLGIIDDEYLSHYGKEGDLIEIEMQKGHVAQDITVDYEISPNVSPDGKAQIAYGYVIGDYADYEKIAAFSLISSVLCSNNESPLKKAILSKGLGEDISFDVQDGILQPFVEIDITNTDLAKEKEIYETITEVLKKQVKEGIDRKELEAALNVKEFKAKERDFGRTPKGLVFALSALDSWLYGGDPLDSLLFNQLFDSLRAKLDSDYYERILEELILDSRHCAKVMLKPSNTLGQIKADKEKTKLAKIAEKWTAQDRERLVEENKQLQHWQSLEDTPEQKATLPALHIGDLKKTPTAYEYSVDDYDGNPIICHDDDTNGISYVSLYIKANDLQLEEYTVLAQMLSYMGQLATAKYDPLTLSREMRRIMGDFDTSFSPALTFKLYEQQNNVTVSFSSLHRNDAEAVELAKEIIYHTDFSNKQAIRDILKQNIFVLEQMFTNSGNSLAILRSAACSSPLAALNERIIGYEAYRYLKDLDDKWDEKADHFIEMMKDLQKKIFIRERYTLSVASQDKEAIVKALLEDAPHGQIGEETVKEVLGHRKEGIAVPSNVSFAAKSLLLKDYAGKLGVMYVVSNILTYDYLWNNIRVKGGAYGCGFRFGYLKTAGFYSYRDPDPKNSLRIYQETVDYLKDFLNNVDNIENYIVGTTGDYDPLLTVKSAIKAADNEYLMGISYEDKKEILDQIINTSKDDIRNVISLFEKINERDDVCIIGNRNALENCKDQLDVIFDLNG